MVVKFTTFSKRKNSTARPSAYTKTVDCQLKAGCSTENPVFYIAKSNWDIDYTYAYVPDWASYYFLTDVVRLTGELWQVSFTMDTLATYKTDIGNYTCFVERASSSYNSMLPDGALSAENDYAKTSSSQTDIGFNTTGVYLLRTVGEMGTYGSATGVQTYALTSTAISTVLDFMFTYSNFADYFTDNIIQSFFNPFQYIVDLRWIPISASDPAFVLMSPGSDSVHFGWWSTSTTAPVIDSFGYTKSSVALSVPISNYTDWRLYDPKFVRYEMYLPGIGVINLDNYTANHSPYISWTLDFESGELAYMLYQGTPSSGKLVATYHTTMAAPVKIGQTGSPISGVLSSVTGMLTSALTGNVVGLAGSAINGIQSSLAPTPSINGTAGNRKMLQTSDYTNINVSMFETESAAYPTAVQGRPLCQNVKLSTLSGYIQCAGASVSVSATDSERDTINSYLNNGFYYE